MRSGLETLVWPGQEDRLGRLRAAIDMARSDPPTVVKGDLLTDLAPLMATAPKDATLVVFHTAVLAYVSSRARRDQFARTVRKANQQRGSRRLPVLRASSTARARARTISDDARWLPGSVDRTSRAIDRLVWPAVTPRLDRSGAAVWSHYLVTPGGNISFSPSTSER